MTQFDYHGLSLTGNEAVRKISDGIENVTDVDHLGPWTEEEKSGNNKLYTYNNTDDTSLPPLFIHVRDDAVIELTTTAYGSTSSTGHEIKLARKGTSRDESAEEWVEERFNIES